MIQVHVRSLWQTDKVGIHEKYINSALASGQGLYLLLVSNGEAMEIPPDQVQAAQVARSKHRFRDKYGAPDYYLVYYKWVPTAKQGMLV